MGTRLGVTLLGATGSVGRQALEVIQAFPERFRVVALTANKNAADMAKLVVVHRPKVVAMVEAQAAEQLRQLLRGNAGVKVLSGPTCLSELATVPEADVVVASIVGHGGLTSVMAAVRAGKRIALANKESLVMAGELIMAESKRSGAVILPVDSEHAAIHQMIRGLGAGQIRKVVLTASGGPFLGYSRKQLEGVSVDQALAHPNWQMGAKISVDSATMMNKGFEVMEAHWLFGLPPEGIEVVVHPESLVHALVEIGDGSMLAQMAQPDMRVSIANALGYPTQLDLPQRLQDLGRLNLARIGQLTFRRAEPGIYPALELCRRAMQLGGGVPAALSLADEVAVDLLMMYK